MDPIKNSDILYSQGQGVLHVIDQDGVELGQLLVPEGRHRGSLWTDLRPQGGEVQAGEGVIVFPARSGVNVQRHPLAGETGANPLFEPSSAATAELRARMMIKRIHEAANTAEKRIRAAQSIPAVVPPAPPPGATSTTEGEASVVE